MIDLLCLSVGNERDVVFKMKLRNCIGPEFIQTFWFPNQRWTTIVVKGSDLHWTASCVVRLSIAIKFTTDNLVNFFSVDQHDSPKVTLAPFVRFFLGDFSTTEDAPIELFHFPLAIEFEIFHQCRQPKDVPAVQLLVFHFSPNEMFALVVVAAKFSRRSCNPIAVVIPNVVIVEQKRWPTTLAHGIIRPIDQSWGLRTQKLIEFPTQLASGIQLHHRSGFVNPRLRNFHVPNETFLESLEQCIGLTSIPA